MDQMIECAHCKGKGLCNNVNGKSCDACLSAKNLQKGVVPCDCCKGLGKNSLWNIQQSETLSRPIEDTLTGYLVQEEQKTLRKLDFRRFVITLCAFIVGVLLVITGILSKNLGILLPVASGLMTGAIGYYVGGQLNQPRSRNEKDEKSPTTIG